MTKRYDLEDRTLNFSKRIVSFIRQLPKTIANLEYAKQLARSAGSIGANYREANESLGKKDFMMRVKIARKEAKETFYWLQLVESVAPEREEHQKLMQESIELKKILSSIIEKSQ